MTTLIIPDLHLRYKRAQQIIDHEACDRVLFLGDFFDDWHDTPEMNRKMALWVKSRQLRHPEDIWLFGNHDTSYAFNLPCSGYSIEKSLAINEVMVWGKFKFYHFLGPWLCTHAGLHPSYIPPLTKDLAGWLASEQNEALEALQKGGKHWITAAGKARGGSWPWGGLTWLDFREEFEPVPGLNQVFGHTPMHAPGLMQQADSTNHCLDALTAYYAVYNDELNKLDVRHAFDEIPNFK
jgi:hypothetical protein